MVGAERKIEKSWETMVSWVLWLKGQTSDVEQWSGSTEVLASIFFVFTCLFTFLVVVR